MAKQHLDKLHSKPLSWSAISSYEYDKEQWAKKYLEGVTTPASPQMLFGNVVGNKLAKDPTYLPVVLRYDAFEPCLTATLDGIPLIGYFDSLDTKEYHFYEYKTSSNKDKWTHKSANLHGQILFYLTLIYLNTKRLPEMIKIKLFYIPVISDDNFKLGVNESGIQSFEIKHTTTEMLKFMKKIKKIYKAMENMAKNKAE